MGNRELQIRRRTLIRTDGISIFEMKTFTSKSNASYGRRKPFCEPSTGNRNSGTVLNKRAVERSWTSENIMIVYTFYLGLRF